MNNGNDHDNESWLLTIIFLLSYQLFCSFVLALIHQRRRSTDNIDVQFSLSYVYLLTTIHSSFSFMSFNKVVKSSRVFISILIYICKDIRKQENDESEKVKLTTWPSTTLLKQESSLFFVKWQRVLILTRKRGRYYYCYWCSYCYLLLMLS